MPTAPRSISIHDLVLRADDVVAQRPDAGQVVLVPDRMRLAQRRGDLIHLRLRLFERDAGLQARDR